MARSSLAQVQRWFEERFAEVHVFGFATHPPGLPPSVSPNGHTYLTLVHGRLQLEGGHYPDALASEADAAEAWLSAAVKLHELLGEPKYLWWRTVPEYENGRVYSRFIATHGGPYVSYKGQPIPRAA
jgi:hypothetical protein